MNPQQVIDLLKTSESEAQWNANCDTIKKACGGYPDFWWNDIILSGVMRRIANRWGGDDQVRIRTIRDIDTLM